MAKVNKGTGQAKEETKKKPLGIVSVKREGATVVGTPPSSSTASDEVTATKPNGLLNKPQVVEVKPSTPIGTIQSPASAPVATSSTPTTPPTKSTLGKPVKRAPQVKILTLSGPDKDTQYRAIGLVKGTLTVKRRSPEERQREQEARRQAISEVISPPSPIEETKVEDTPRPVSTTEGTVPDTTPTPGGGAQPEGKEEPPKRKRKRREYILTIDGKEYRAIIKRPGAYRYLSKRKGEQIWVVYPRYDFPPGEITKRELGFEVIAVLSEKSTLKMKDQVNVFSVRGVVAIKRQSNAVVKVYRNDQIKEGHNKPPKFIKHEVEGMPPRKPICTRVEVKEANLQQGKGLGWFWDMELRLDTSKGEFTMISGSPIVQVHKPAPLNRTGKDNTGKDANKADKKLAPPHTTSEGNPKP